MTPLARRLLIAFAIAFAVYTLAGFLIAPPLIRSAILANLDKTLTTKASLRRVRVNPLALSMTLEGLTIPDPDGTSAVSFSKLYLRFNIFSPFFRAWTLDELRLESPAVHVAVLGDRSLSLLRLLRAPAVTPDAMPANPHAVQPEPPALLVRKLSILKGTASLEDHSRTPTMHEGLIPIRIELTDFSTRRDQNNAYSFEATTERGEVLSWYGRFTTQPFTSDGVLRIKNVAAKTLEEVLGPEGRPYELTSGGFTLTAGYRADATTTPPSFRLSGMNVSIHDLAISDRATGEEAIRVGSIETRGGSIRSDRREADLGTLTADSVHVLVTMDSTGVTNLQRWTETPPDTAPPWTTKIPAIAFHRLGLEYQDRRASPPGILRARSGQGELKGYSSAPGTEVPVSAACSLSTDGYATASGTLKPDKGAVDLKLDLHRLAATELEPFVSPFAKLKIPHGTVSASGRLEYNTHGPAGPALRFTGQASSAKFAAYDRKLNEEFLSCDRLELRGLQYDMDPSRVVIHEIVTEKPYMRFVVAPDLTTNVQAIMVPPDSIPAAFRAPPGAPDTIPTEIGSIQVRNGSMYFADHSLTPHFATGIYAMNGSIRELSSSRTSHAVMEIDGKVDDHAPVKIHGTINPLNSHGATDVGLKFENIELTTFTPYSGKFMGYRIERGKLDLDLDYAIQDRQLKAENKILMRQFTLGDKVDSKDATHLPVKFAIALLKDKDGNIDLDLPVHGDLNDPKFSVMKIVVKVLVQLVVKAVTSPFKLFGAIFGGDGAESAPAIRFPYGSASLDTTEIAKLVAIQKGLAEKRALMLEIEQAGMAERDSVAIVERKFAERVRSAAVRSALAARPDPALIAAAAQRAPAGFTGLEYAQGVTGAYTTSYGKLPPFQKPPGKQAKGAVPDSALVAAQGQWLDGIMARVRSAITVTPDEVAGLANDRARRIQGYLLQDTTLTADRLFIVTNKGTYPPDSAGVRAGLTLRD